MAAPRPVAVANLSHFDRILVLPTAAVARVPVAAAPTPLVQRPPAVPAAAALIPTTTSRAIVQPPRGPIFPTVPANPSAGRSIGDTRRVSTATDAGAALAGVAAEQQGGQPISIAPFPGATAVGTPRPGMVVQPRSRAAWRDRPARTARTDACD